MASVPWISPGVAVEPVKARLAYLGLSLRNLRSPDGEVRGRAFEAEVMLGIRSKPANTDRCKECTDMAVYYFDGTVGDDVMYGSSYDDYMSGGSGRDTIYGQDGNDELYGGDNSDILVGGAGNDGLSGGSSNDTYQFSGSFGQDSGLRVWRSCVVAP